MSNSNDSSPAANETSGTTPVSTPILSITTQSTDKVVDVGVIVGPVVGGVVFLLLIIIVTVFIWRWRKRKTRRRKSPAPLPDLRTQTIESLDKSIQGSPSTTPTTSEQHTPRASHNDSFGVDTDIETSRDSLSHLPDLSKTDLPNLSPNWNITSGPLINKAISESNINRTPRNQPMISTSDENGIMDYMDMNSNSVRPFVHKFRSQRYVNLQNDTPKLKLSPDTSQESLEAKESPKKSKTNVQDSLEEDGPQEDYINMSNELFHQPTGKEIKAEKSSKSSDLRNNEDIKVEEGQQDSYINMAEIDIKPPTLLSATDTRKEVSRQADADMKNSNESTDNDEPEDYINVETVVIPLKGESNTQVLNNRSGVSTPNKQEISPKPSTSPLVVSSPLNKDNHSKPSNNKSIGPQLLNQNNSSLTSLTKRPVTPSNMNKEDSFKTSDTVSKVPTPLKQETQPREKTSNIPSLTPERNQIAHDDADSSDSEPLEDYVNVEEKFQPPHLSSNATQKETIPQTEILKESSSSNSLPGLKQAPPTLPKSKAAKNISDELVKTKPNSNKINSHKQQTIAEVQEDNSIYENANEKPHLELLKPQSNFKDNAGKISPKLNALLSNSKGMQRKPPAVSPKPK